MLANSVIIGERYEGEFKHDRKEGQGLFVWTEDTFYYTGLFEKPSKGFWFFLWFL